MSYTQTYFDQAASGANNGTSPTDAWQTFAAAIAGITAGPASVPTIVNWKVNASPYAQTTTNRTINTVGATLAPVWWRGYKTTPGDQDTNYAAVANVDIPQLTFTTGQLTISALNNRFSGLDITGATVAANGLVVLTTGSMLQFLNVRFTNTAANANSSTIQATSSSNGNDFVMCRFTADLTTPTNNVFWNSSVANYMKGCVATGGIVGLKGTNSGNATVADCIFDSQAGDAISLNTNILMDGLIIYGAAGNGINLTGISSSGVQITNCYFEAINTGGKFAINNTSGANTSNVLMLANGYFNCAGTRSGFTEDFTMFDAGTLGASALVNPAAKNFAIQGAALGVGYPGNFAGTSLFQGYRSLGATQPNQSGGGIIASVGSTYLTGVSNPVAQGWP